MSAAGDKEPILASLARRAATTTLTQAVRMIELLGRLTPGLRARHPIGADSPAADEAVHLVASDRMRMPIGDIADIAFDEKGQPFLTANVLGLVGASPALPAAYSELQLQRRRLRDRSMAAFYNLFDHRALSFFYRASAKHHWTIAVERTGDEGLDPITSLLLSNAGLPNAAQRQRLPFDDRLLAPVAGQAADTRRSAGAVQAILRHLTGLPLRIVEGEPRWMPVPPEEQTRIGRSGFARFAQLGGEAAARADDPPMAAMLGMAVLDAQHHYGIEITPLSYSELLMLATDPAAIAELREACHLAAGLVHKPLLRLGILASDVRPMVLGSEDTPACLGRTSWLGAPESSEAPLFDCTIGIAA